MLVCGGAERKTVPEPDEVATLLEVTGELCVVNPDRIEACELELGQEVLRLPVALAEGRLRSGQVEPGATALDVEQRQDVTRPRLCRRVDARIEWIGRGEAPVQLLAKGLEPAPRERPITDALEALRLPVEDVAERGQAHGLVDRRGDVTALEEL